MFGVPITNLTMDEAVHEIGDLVVHGRRTGTVHQIATVNVDFLVNAIADRDLRGVLQGATLCLADGTPVVWTASLLGVPLPERVAGSDLVPRLVAESEVMGWKIHVFGSAPEVARQAFQLLKARHPGASLTIDPGPRIADPRHVDDDIIEAIRSVDADIVLVALGNPKQEWFIDAHKDRLGSPVMMGIGGSLDMLVGHRQRAPRWVQQCGLEWVVRAAQEPRRLLPRYARDLRVFVPALARELLAQRRSLKGARLRLDLSADLVSATITDSTALRGDTWSSSAQEICTGKPLRVTVESTSDYMRRPALAALTGLTQLAHLHSSVTWTSVPPTVAAWCDAGTVPPAMLSAVDIEGDGDDSASAQARIDHG
jgi:N-acetylglucosaminyldiphosphoundecaprenol N-acetyl-beta-D-mannosaminyltransferase